MVDLTVALSKLTGFTLDLQDIGANFTENAGRLLPGLVLPAGTSGQLAQLSLPIQQLQATLSGDHQKDTSALGTLGSGLGTSATAYQNSDEQHAVSLNQAGASLTDGQSVAATGSAVDIRRFTGLQELSLQNVEEAQYTVRQAVTGCIELLTSYDEPLGRTIGIKPIAEYLAPVEADWEALRGVGKRIGLLGINDFAHSQNLFAGIGWIQADWIGAAATSFAATATALGQSLDTRSIDLDAVSKIVENGALLLERLVYNQAADLAGSLTKRMTFANFTLPLASWAQLIDQPMDESAKSQITSAVDELKKSVATRQDAITTTIQRISGALGYESGRAAPVYNASEFELPEKVIIDTGTIRYGYGDNVWFELAVSV
ncbi:hypothetical protein NN3_09890 [Nocardia neocaledoniensis NBRC 108232]|uniref:Excreted virulence factor EspC (Type VII ESX diderm) n=1 Tax=Nocardia neocaledoniensis TaxID=236511 RepID=A0A317NE43_9NOCA|nr:hypothetical protein [Nocardia neocaledoniensis]PWV73425.1 hypothetical protein DFR69_10751 [Nocardia neocaledoniensis]GEM29982.1 hypothetical protein NN3_09890 [Nocardia neocaledoniensis NBRC 108232]